jgi:hypothetical protein
MHNRIVHNWHVLVAQHSIPESGRNDGTQTGTDVTGVHKFLILVLLHTLQGQNVIEALGRLITCIEASSRHIIAHSSLIFDFLLCLLPFGVPFKVSETLCNTALDLARLAITLTRWEA